MMSPHGLPGVAEVAVGSAVYISRGSAVMSVAKLRLSGFIGWWGWLFIHVGFMTGFRNRFGAVLSWCTRGADRPRILSASRCSRPGGPLR
jgi:NADH dehydrogenase